MAVSGINEITAPDAAAELGKLNDFGRTEWSDKWFADANPVWIYNVNWREHWREDLAGLGKVLIPACPKGQTHSPAVCFHGYCAEGGFGCKKKHEHKSAVPGMYRDEYRLIGGDGQMGWRPVSGDELAATIVGTNTSAPSLDINTTNREWWGTFRAVSERPSSQEIMGAHEKLRQLAALIVADADAMAAQGAIGVTKIRHVHREMLEYLHEKRSWMSVTPGSMEVCDGCQEPMRAGVVVHSCGNVIDPDKALAKGMIDRARYDQIMEARTAPKKK